MERFSLLKPIKVNCTVPIYKSHRKAILETISVKPNKWSYGNVDATRLPTEFADIYQEPVERLNLQIGDKWKDLKYIKGCDMPYGRGSIGSHIDEITGLTMLVLIFCEPWVQEKDHPEYDGFSGEFFAGTSSIQMKVGDVIVFDDRQPHAWLTNSAWVFATFPLKVEG